MLLPSTENVAGNALGGPHVHQGGTGNLKGRIGETQRTGSGEAGREEPHQQGRETGRKKSH